MRLKMNQEINPMLIRGVSQLTFNDGFFLLVTLLFVSWEMSSSVTAWKEWWNCHSSKPQICYSSMLISFGFFPSPPIMASSLRKVQILFNSIFFSRNFLKLRIPRKGKGRTNCSTPRNSTDNVLQLLQRGNMDNFYWIRNNSIIFWFLLK